MQCVTHPTEAATSICTRCDKLLCAACTREHNGKNFCADCADFLGQRAQQRQAVAPPALAGGAPAEIYQGPPAGDAHPGPPPGQSSAPADIYQGPTPAGAPQQLATPQPPPAPAAASRPPAANPYQSAAPAVGQGPPAANPYASPAPANPYQSPAPAAAPAAAPANPYASPAPTVSPSAPVNPYQAPAPAAVAPPQEGSIGLAATPPPPAPVGDVYQEPPGDVYQGPPGDVYQGPPTGDVYQGPPTGDVYQGPPAEGVYQGPPAEGVYQGQSAAAAPVSVMLENADDEGSLGRAAMMSAVAGLVGVLISWGISAATGKILKLSSVWLFLGPMIGRTAVQGAGRGGGDVALVATGVTIVALFFAEIIVGYQRGYIEVGILDWVFWAIGGYWAYRIPAERA